MKTHHFSVATALVAAGLAVAATGCILGSDPNKNSMLFGKAGASGGGGGAGGSTVSDPTGPIMGTPLAVFMSGIEGFSLNNYADPTNTNLNDPGRMISPAPTFGFDSTAGSPDPGSLKVMAPYSGANQYVDIQKSFTSDPQNWTGKTLHVRVRATEGSFGGGAQVYVNTIPGTFVFGGTSTNFAKNNAWQDFAVNLDAPTTTGTNGVFDPSRVIQIGVQLSTGTAGAGSTPVTFNIDSFSIFPPLPGAADAGADAGTSGDAAAPSDAAADASSN
jgi:hypothetical protein